MPRRRLWLVHALIAILIGGHLYDIALDREHWPFSQYPMFSDVDESTTHRTLRLFGVSGGDEIPLLRFDDIAPLDQCRVSSALIHMSHRPSARSDLRQALGNIWTAYERRRKAGRMSGPSLSGIRLYALQWNLDPRAQNADRPEVRELVVEFRAPGENASAGESVR